MHPHPTSNPLPLSLLIGTMLADRAAVCPENKRPTGKVAAVLGRENIIHLPAAWLGWWRNPGIFFLFIYLFILRLGDII